MHQGFKAKVLASIVAAALCLPLAAACSSKNDEDVIRDSIAYDLEGYKNADEHSLADLASDMDIDELAQFGIDAEDFMRTYLDGFDYSIDSIAIDGDHATAVVTISCRSFSQYESELGRATEALKSDAGIAGMSSSELNELFGATIMDALDAAEIAPTDPIAIEYTKSGSTWNPSATASYDIAKALMSN